MVNCISQRGRWLATGVAATALLAAGLSTTAQAQAAVRPPAPTLASISQDSPPILAAVRQPSTTHRTTKVYVVKRGDSLSAITAKVFHKAAVWPRFYATNRKVIGPYPDVIVPGQRLRERLARHGMTGRVVPIPVQAPSAVVPIPAGHAAVPAGQPPAATQPLAAAPSAAVAAAALVARSVHVCALVSLAATTRRRTPAGITAPTSSPRPHGRPTEAAQEASATPAQRSRTRCSPTPSRKVARATGHLTTGAARRRTHAGHGGRWRLDRNWVATPGFTATRGELNEDPVPGRVLCHDPHHGATGPRPNRRNGGRPVLAGRRAALARARSRR